MIRCGTGTFLKNKTLSFRFSTNNRMHAPRTFYYHEYKKPRKSICFSGAKSLSIPRYHPHWKMMSFSSSFRSLCLTRTHVLTYFRSTAAVFKINRSCKFLFNQSAPECSLDLLSQTALSVGDAVFLSTPKDQSLFHRFTVLTL